MTRSNWLIIGCIGFVFWILNGNMSVRLTREKCTSLSINALRWNVQMSTRPTLSFKTIILGDSTCRWKKATIL
jgi:hypothetical protein